MHFSNPIEFTKKEIDKMIRLCKSTKPPKLETVPPEDGKEGFQFIPYRDLLYDAQRIFKVFNIEITDVRHHLNTVTYCVSVYTPIGRRDGTGSEYLFKDGQYVISQESATVGMPIAYTRAVKNAFRLFGRRFQVPEPKEPEVEIQRSEKPNAQEKLLN